MSTKQPTMIKFRRTQGNQGPIELAYEPAKTVEEYVSDLAELHDADPIDIKLVHKGKILNWKTTAEANKLEASTVMVVLNPPKKEQKKPPTSKQQVVPGAGMATGLGSSSPFGVGGYEAVNHPQYMSAISSAVDPDKLEELLDDPQYQGMMEQLMQDPDTLRQLMEENPMMKNMMNSNPMMKNLLANPAMLKMIFNKDTIKQTKDYLKNGGTIHDLQQNQFVTGIRGPVNGANGSPQQPMQYPGFNNLMNGGQAFPNSPMYPSFYNPMGFGFVNPQAQAEIQRVMDENLYKDQLKELESMGFKDKARNLAVLREVKGNVDHALEKLCSD